jgi:hypothetical protein
MKVRLMPKSLLLPAAAFASFAMISGANATITITLASPGNDATFDNNPVGATSGGSSAAYNGSVGSIYFVTGSDTTGVTNGTSGVAAEPLGDTSNYLWGVESGANSTLTTVYFGTSPTSTVPTTSFLIHWGSVDSSTGPNNDGYDNVLTLSNGDSITGSQLVAMGLAVGSGSQTNPADNPWLLISDTTPFTSFTAASPQNSFEFDMSVPEPATWAMLGLGLAALGYAGFRRSAKGPAALA